VVILTLWDSRYKELHRRLRWAAVQAIRAGDDTWFVSIQRSIAQGPFEPDEQERLAQLCLP